jgi:hypothetical protein
MGRGYAEGVERREERLQVEGHAAERHVPLATIACDHGVLVRRGGESAQSGLRGA